jgi:hypothetical protein
MKRLSALLLAAAVLSVGTLLGCYTMFGHPAVPDYGYSDEYVDTDKTCSDCHAESGFYHWSDPYYSSSYYAYPAPWAVFYGQTGWYNPHVHHPGAGNDDEYGLPQEVGGRHAWDRGPGAPEIPRVGGGITVTPAPPPPAQTEQSPPAANTDSTQSTDRPRQTQQQTDKNQNQGKNRHGWSR